MSQVMVEDRFLFDLQGFLVLRGVLSVEESSALLEKLWHLEKHSYEDKWLESLEPGSPGRPTKEISTCQVRLNGLPRLDPLFDLLIDHPKVVPLLKEFIGDPQLINTWSISKESGARPGGWHRGVPTTDYSFHHGQIRSRMLNTVWFLTDNGPDDGCVIALPGSHKSNMDLEWHKYPGLALPGAVPVVGKAGDVLLFSETLMHNGGPKTTPGIRSNLYYNYVHAHYNVMTREPRNCHHFYFPPRVRQRFTPSQRELTKWMEFTKWDY